MARPVMPLGTHGKIRGYGWIDDRWVPEEQVPQAAKRRLGKWKAITNYRGLNGKTRQVERVGTTLAKATATLKGDLAKDAGKSKTLTTTSRFGAAAAAWLEGIEKKVEKDKRSPTTLARYRSRLNVHVLPAFEHLTLAECKTARFQQFFNELDEAGLSPNSQRGIRNVCSGVMAWAVRNVEGIDSNPLRDVEDIEGGAVRAAVAMPVDEFQEFLAKVDSDMYSVKADLPDLLRWFFGTGTRVGEALAMTWRYVNLTDKPIIRTAFGKKKVIPPRSVWVNATMAAVTGQGLVRKKVKAPRSNRIIALPDFLVLLLQVRRPAGVGIDEPVYPSKVLTFRHPNNVQLSIERMRKRIGYPDFTTHVGRKTVGTAMDKGGHTAREVANQLGQSRIQTAQDFYLDREGYNPEAAATIDAMHRRRS